MKNIPQLIESHKRLIESEAAKYAQFVPLTVAQVEAYHLAHEAAESYDESSGNKFSTYLTNSLKKLSRLSTQYGSLARLPENKQFKVNKLNQADAHLQSELGRVPTVAELADATGYGIPAINSLLTNRKKEVNLNNLAHMPVFVESSDMDDWIHFVYYDLPERDKFIFEHRTGFGGKPILDNSVIAKKLNIPVSTVVHRIKLFSAKLAEKQKK